VYEGAIISTTNDNNASKLYMDYLMGTKAQVVFKKFGFISRFK